MTDEARARVRWLLLTGDNRLKQGGPVQRARRAKPTSGRWPKAEARGVDDELIRGLLERRIADTRLLEVEP